MAEEKLAAALDEMVEAILAGREPARWSPDPTLAALAAVAGDLRHLPREEFRKRLKAELRKERPMPPATADPIRPGFQTITPYLSVRAASELIDFVKSAFEAEELMRTTGSAGETHCEVRIGDSIVMIGGGSAWRGTPMPTSIHLYVKDADEVYRRALAAGAASIEEPVDQPYGDREAGVKDVAGNNWWIATHRATGLAPAGFRSVTAYLHPRSAASMIDFLERALGAEEVERHQSADGVVHHAQVRIGDSILEMGEAHGPYQPMPSMFYLSVGDVDGLYQRAVASGAVSKQAPTDQDYGDRVASVADPFGNLWYLATHIRGVAP
jgi:PhnB protein